MRRTADEVNEVARLGRAAFSKMGFVRSFSSEIRGSEAKKAEKTAKSGGFSERSAWGPPPNWFQEWPGRQRSARHRDIGTRCPSIVPISSQNRPNTSQYRTFRRSAERFAGDFGGATAACSRPQFRALGKCPARRRSLAKKLGASPRDASRAAIDLRQSRFSQVVAQLFWRLAWTLRDLNP